MPGPVKHQISGRSTPEQLQLFTEKELIPCVRETRKVVNDICAALGSLSSARKFTTTAPLTIDGGASADLSADRTLAVSGATTGARGVVKLASDLGGTADQPLVVGLTGSAGAVAVHGTTLAVDGTTLTLSFGGVTVALIGTDGSGKFISVGTNPATIGNLRFQNNSGIYIRNFANTADILALQVSTADAVNIGDGANTQGVNINTAGGMIQMTFGGTGYWTLASGITRLNAWNAGDMASLACGASALIAASQLTATRRIAAIFAGNGFSTTQMPANTGDLVMYIANAATAPTANAVGGGILYASGGALHWRGSGGTDTIIGPA